MIWLLFFSAVEMPVLTAAVCLVAAADVVEHIAAVVDCDAVAGDTDKGDVMPGTAAAPVDSHVLTGRPPSTLTMRNDSLKFSSPATFLAWSGLTQGACIACHSSGSNRTLSEG